MKTPKHMVEALKKGILTDEILGACIYSCNKRAKNCRDQARDYRENHAWKYAVSYTCNKEYYYSMKDRFLSIVEPECIHVETFIKEWHDPYGMLTGIKEITLYYYFYRVGKYSFHSPIPKAQIQGGTITEEAKKGLQVTKIPHLQTYGHSTDDLLSVQFCRKVLALIESGHFTYSPDTDGNQDLNTIDHERTA